MRVDKSILLLKVFAAGSQLDNVLIKDALLLGPAQLRLNKRVFSSGFSLLCGMELGQCVSLAGKVRFAYRFHSLFKFVFHCSERLYVRGV